MKKKETLNASELSTEELITGTARRRVLRKRAKFILAMLLIAPVAVGAYYSKLANSVEDDAITSLNLISAPIAATSNKKSVITIPTGTVNKHPFLPYRDISGTSASGNVQSFDVIAPPEVIATDSEAAKLMNTVVSGILFDKYSPSAILNIEGSDYLVKKGDVVNNYKVLSIMQDSVTVKLGENTYKAGIGEILTEGSVNHNDVSNLNNKFGGGDRQWDITIYKDSCQLRCY